MQPDSAAVVAPDGRLPPGIVQSVEYLPIQQRLALIAVETVDKAVLLRRVGVEVASANGVLVGPGNPSSRAR